MIVFSYSVINTSHSDQTDDSNKNKYVMDSCFRRNDMKNIVFISCVSRMYQDN
jgi:hypothetical protein